MCIAFPIKSTPMSFHLSSLQNQASLVRSICLEMLARAFQNKSYCTFEEEVYMGEFKYDDDLYC